VATSPYMMAGVPSPTSLNRRPRYGRTPGSVGPEAQHLAPLERAALAPGFALRAVASFQPNSSLPWRGDFIRNPGSALLKAAVQLTRALSPC